MPMKLIDATEIWLGLYKKKFIKGFTENFIKAMSFIGLDLDKPTGYKKIVNHK